MHLRKSIALLAAAATTLSLVACSDSSDSSGDAAANGDSGATGGDNYVTSKGSEPQNPLIPADTNEVGGGNIIDQIFAGLVYYDAEGEVHNEVAESIETEDNQNYTVTIKEGQVFSDGSPVTAANFVDSWNYAVENSLLSAYFFEPIKGYSEEGGQAMEGLQVVDDQTFTIELN
ncbi:Oligopeptide-binding protein OppA precursor [Corynebacterium guangdongense]|uniref:ABC-type oligopeptide transport system substrate-binding subunit n=1 Tax=Corynebacterium guangdongense TaxID=1783348 RepID=A0ABU1ZVN9_9CORY|nr:ABC-type oligopeptide transport system substrate-binding subunit [Corynebacterium guangdongense]WJZ17574.1 Oligopeptide-binding protein OppA precursor [Corynebacterium guangdongense]